MAKVSSTWQNSTGIQTSEQPLQPWSCANLSLAHELSSAGLLDPSYCPELAWGSMGPSASHGQVCSAYPTSSFRLAPQPRL